MASRATDTKPKKTAQPRAAEPGVSSGSDEAVGFSACVSIAFYLASPMNLLQRFVITFSRESLSAQAAAE